MFLSRSKNRNFSLSRCQMGSNRLWNDEKKIDAFFSVARKLADKNARRDKLALAFLNGGVVKFIFLDSTSTQSAKLNESVKTPRLVTGIAKVPKNLTEAELSAFLATTSYVYKKKIAHEIVLSLVSRTADFVTELTDNSRNLREGCLLITLDRSFDKKPTHKFVNTDICCIQTDYSIGKFELSAQSEMRRKMLRDSLDWQKQKKVQGKLKQAA